MAGCGADDDPPAQSLWIPGEPIGQGRPCTGSDLDADPTALLYYFIDVGQGDAIWIRTPDDGVPDNGRMEGLEILVDLGDSGLIGRTDGGAIVVDFLDENGLPTGSSIDWVLVSHAHSDHYGGYRTVYEQYDVVRVVEPGYVGDGVGPAYQGFLTASQAETEANGGELLTPAHGAFVPEQLVYEAPFGEELPVRLLNASDELGPGDAMNDRINNTSIAFELTFGSQRALLMGDASIDVERELVARTEPFDAHLLKVGHHGSATATSIAWLEHVFGDVPSGERYAVISSGRRSFSGTTLPDAATVQRLLAYLPHRNLFSTQYADEPYDESAATDGDHVFAKMTSDGRLDVCYIR